MRTRLDVATLILILLRSMKSWMEVNQHWVMYGTHSLGCFKRWNPHPDSSWSNWRAMRMRLPTESLENRWSVRCCTCCMPCSTLISKRAIPHRSLGPNATHQGNDLLTPSLFRIACTAWSWILFRVSVSKVVTGREYVMDGMYVPQWNMNISISLRFKAANLVAHWFALCERNLDSLW